MKKKTKILLKFLLVLIFLLSSGIFIITKYFSKNIELKIVGSINKVIESPLIFDEVKFTVYDNFPFASVKLTNLLILESKTFDQDTLLFSKVAHIEISLIDIINQNFNINNIMITNAKINLRYNTLNKPNFEIFKKEKTNNNSSISVKKITLNNTELKITKIKPTLSIDWQLKKSIVSIENEEFLFKLDGFSKKLLVGKTDYLFNKRFDLLATTSIKKNTITILSSKLNVEKTSFDINGEIINSNTVDLKIKAQNQKLDQIIAVLPTNINKVTNPFIISGNIDFNSKLKGLINKKNNPFFTMDYTISSSYFKLKSNSFTLQNIEMSGSASNGKDKNFNSTFISVNLFNAESLKGNIKGKFNLKNLNNYYINSEFTSSWELSEVNEYFTKSPFENLNGKLFTNTVYNGNVSFNSDFKKMFLSAKHYSDIKLQNIKFKYINSPLKFDIKSADLTINKEKMSVRSSSSTISETDINFTGKINNLFNYLLEKKSKISILGTINSTYTNFSELQNFSKKNNLTDKKIIPDWIEINSLLMINKLSYNNFVAEKINGKLICLDGKLKGENLTAKSLNGEIASQFTISEHDQLVKLQSDISLKKINIRNSFDAFNNYGQKIIKKEQIKGVGSAEVNIESYWSLPNLTLNTKKLKINSKLVIEKGELIDFKPLENLSSYVSLNELKHVKFSTLENSIDVYNEVITIPTMEIKSSALSVFLSGTHSFNQEIDYDITLLLSELLSKSFRKQNTQITEFGEQKQDGKIFNTVYFKMKGSTKNPKISLNKIRFMEDLNNSIVREKNYIKNIIKEDLLKTKEKKEKEKGQEVEIEWNP